MTTAPAKAWPTPEEWERIGANRPTKAIWTPTDVAILVRDLGKGDQFSFEETQHALWRLPNDWRLFAINLLAGSIHPRNLNDLIARNWTSGGYPASIGVTRCIALLKLAGFVTDRAGAEPPTESLTVYRGCAVGKARGICWTKDMAKAKWFAARYRFEIPGAVYVAEAPPRHVLGIFHDRNESEVVVNPRGLRRVWRLDDEPHRASMHSDGDQEEEQQ